MDIEKGIRYFGFFLSIFIGFSILDDLKPSISLNRGDFNVKCDVIWENTTIQLAKDYFCDRNKCCTFYYSWGNCYRADCFNLSDMEFKIKEFDDYNKTETVKVKK